MLNILEAYKKGQIKSKIVTIVSNNPNSKGLKKAKKYGVITKVINSKDFEYLLSLHLSKYKVNFMKILSKKFLESWEKKIINIHPSLLPAFKGLDTHKRALKMKVKYSGCTIHFVNNKLDSGEIIDQEIVKVLDSDNKNSLKKKILMKEHKLYIRVIKKLEKSNE